MPAPVLSDDKRALPRLTLLFWAGVALAAIAALLLLVADGNGTLRIAAVLAITSVVVIGLSITLRPDDGAAVQELFDEIEELRAELATVARSGHQTAEQAYRAPAAVAAVPRRSGDVTAVDRPGGGSGWARVPVPDAPGVGPQRSDEPEPLRVAEPGGPRRRPEEPEDGPRRREEAPGGRRRLADPEDGLRPEDPPGGRRRSDEPGGRRRQEEPVAGRRRSPEPEDEHVDRARRDAGARDRYRAPRRHDDEPGRFPAGRHDDEPGRFPAGRDDDEPGRFLTGRHDDEPGRFPAGRDEDDWNARRRGRDAYPGRRHDDEESGHRSRPAARYDAERPASGVYGAPPRRDEHDVRPAPEAPPRPVGVVRHTETVHVTTRHTIVDGSGPDPVPGNVYGRWTPAPPPEDQPWPATGPEPADRWDGYAPGPDRARPGHPRESAWRGSERDGRETPSTGRSRPGPDGWSGGRADEHPDHGRAYPAQDAGTDHWSDVRAGDRWAAVRDDGHGRELRMGERRAAMHTDGTGTELRMEDRWATVRRDGPRRERPDSGPERSAPEHPDRGGHWPEPHHALPPGGVPVPQAWRTPRQRQPVDDWPTPDASPRGRGREPGPDGHGHPSRERAGGHPSRGRDGGHPSHGRDGGHREHDPRPPERWH